MIRFRRSRFRDLVSRQLELFAADEGGVLEEARAAEEAWNRAGPEDAEELYGDWQLMVDGIAERLLDLRETYAATLADDSADAYRAPFSLAAAARYREYAHLLE